MTFSMLMVAMPVARSQVEPVLEAAGAAIDRAKAADDLIIRVGNEFKPSDVIGNMFRHHAALAGSPGTAWDPRLHVTDSVYLSKWRANAFCNPALLRLLEESQVGAVRIAGLYAASLCYSDGTGGEGSRTSGRTAL